MTAVKIGQVWKDKDKRRNTEIEIIDLMNSEEVVGLVVGTEEQRVYKVERLEKRWELIEDKHEIVVLPSAKQPWSFKGEMYLLAKPGHVHNDRGECLKNRYGDRCNMPPEVEEKSTGTFVEADRNGNIVETHYELIERPDGSGEVRKIEELTLAEATEAARDGAKLTIHLSEGEKAVLVPERLRKKQASYMLKIVCAVGMSDFKARTTQKMIDEYGFPLCPCHKKPMEWGA